MKQPWLLILATMIFVASQADAEDPFFSTEEADGNHKTVVVECGDFFEYPTLTAWDACDGEITSDIIVGGDEVLPELVGEYVLTYNVLDTAGNAAEEATRTIQVVDTDAPLITVYGNNPALVMLGEAFVDPGANAFDVCDGDLTQQLQVNNPVDVGVSGQYTITYDVEDAAGNAAEQGFRIVNVVNDLPDVGALPDIVLEEGMFYEWDGQVNNEAMMSRFQWYRYNGRFYEPLMDGPYRNGYYQGVNTSVLQFAPFSAAMAGRYMLEVSGDKGSVERTASVTVDKEEGVPVSGVIGLVVIAFAAALTGSAALKRKSRRL